jgi:hypothetical protein
MKQAGEQELLDLLRDIDARLDGEKLKGRITLYVFGGAAAVIAYGSKRGTVDIDGYLEDEKIKKKLLEWAGEGTELAKKHGIYFSSANMNLMLIEDPDWKERCVEILKDDLKHMRIMALGKEDLILSKLSRYNDRDRADIQFIVEHHKIDPKRLIAYYKAARQYYVGRLETLDQTLNIVLGEHFGHKPLKFADPA